MAPLLSALIAKSANIRKTGKTSCDTCPLGFTSNSIKSACQQCTPGKYRDTLYGGCKNCGNGTYSSSVAATTPDACKVSSWKKFRARLEDLLRLYPLFSRLLLLLRAPRVCRAAVGVML